MDQVVMVWFPGIFYANLYGIIVLAAFLSDEIVPYLVGSRGFSYKQSRDRGSFYFIFLMALVGLGAGVYFRYHNICVVPFWVQALALLLIIAGTLIREWAIVFLGRFFSRIVKIEQGHRLITSGSNHWPRHPSYTGMLIMYVSILLGLGIWLGALLTLFILLIPTLYRIRVEEKVLLEIFGDEYRAYMNRT